MIVSFVVPTRNSAATLGACLQSLRAQEHPEIEIIVVDNSSTDGTVTIAEGLADIVVTHGPERSAQRNQGLRLARGEVVVFIDSDMVVDPLVAAEICARVGDADVGAWVLPERVMGSTYLARCRALEKAAYIGEENIEAARAFRVALLRTIGGYDEALTGPEDWELPDRVRSKGWRIGRTASGVSHDESIVTLATAFRKKQKYAASLATYFRRAGSQRRSRLLRWALVRAVAQALMTQPHLVPGLVALRTVEAVGFLTGLMKHSKESIPRTLIVSHVLFDDGAAQALERHLGAQGGETTSLYLPLPGSNRDCAELRENGRSRSIRYRGPFATWPLSLIADLVIASAIVLRRSRGVSLVIGVDPLNAIAAIVVRAVTRRRYPVVLFEIDYSPARFKNAMLNRTYHVLDEWACGRADAVWNVSRAMISAREADRGRASRRPQLIVPIGLDRIRSDAQDSPTNRIVFLGHLRVGQGVETAIEAVALLVASHPDVFLDIIGAGPEESALRQLVASLGLAERVHFLGYVSDPARLHEVLGQGGIGVAPYADTPDTFTRFADPSKIKSYVAAALPVVVTSIPPVAEELQEIGAGVIVETDAPSMARALASLLDDLAAYRAASESARRFASRYLWADIFDSALARTAEITQRKAPPDRHGSPEGSPPGRG